MTHASRRRLTDSRTARTPMPPHTLHMGRLKSTKAHEQAAVARARAGAGGRGRARARRQARHERGGVGGGVVEGVPGIAVEPRDLFCHIHFTGRNDHAIVHRLAGRERRDIGNPGTGDLDELRHRSPPSGIKRIKCKTCFFFGRFRLAIAPRSWTMDRYWTHSLLRMRLSAVALFPCTRVPPPTHPKLRRLLELLQASLTAEILSRGSCLRTYR